ncbi:uncharacterized protein N7483_007619 [Penicillium malachiteum]|uniref:uncharacterized protein n=1 Tax=Penicillium malachiteum TaxID=1324776 RepID=UPI00254837E6|nr:uncharacterized protein N7483_007619 [Penicillium malachiteum]KAJ5726262.1 hypothetical protein N7483_007619 [Penicillium malachiteum]
MVYQGKPSSGCKNCRQRRIKCDETRPNCNACTRTGRSCPGYLDPFDLILRDHTPSFISKKGTKKAPPRKITKSEPRHDSNENHDEDRNNSHTKASEASGRSLSLTTSTKSSTSWPPYIPPADLYQPMEDTVIPLFFNSYLYLPQEPHVRNGFMEILPELFSNARPGSYVHTSTLAVAFFSVAAWTGHAPLLKAAQRYFTQALPKIRAALLSNDDGEYDSILMSILNMSTYEIQEFVAIREWETPMRAHLKGAIALINSRRSKLLESPSSSTLHHAVQTQILSQIKTSRGLQTPMVPTPEIWPIPQCETPPSPRIFLSSFAAEVVNLRQSWEKSQSENSDETQVSIILDKATQIDAKLLSWSYCVPQDWNPIPASIIPESVRNAGIYHNLCDCYTDMWIASTWNTYRECRILVQSIMLRCLHLLPSKDKDATRESAMQSTIQKLADDICASVPFFLGSQTESVRMKTDLVEYPFSETRPVTSTHKQAAPLMGAWQVISRLRNLQRSELGLPPEQITWLEEQVNRVFMIYFQKPA